MFKRSTRHSPRPEQGEAVCPHGRIEGREPCAKCAGAWRKRNAKELRHGKGR